MKIGFGRLVIAIALLIVGLACWTQARLMQRVGDARERLATLQYDLDAVPPDDAPWFLTRSLPGFDRLRDEVRRLRIQMSYWRNQSDEPEVGIDARPAAAVNSTPAQASGGKDPDELFADTNRAFRAAQRLSGDRAAVVARLDKVVEAYAEVLRSAPWNADASYNYEYTARYRDTIARGKGPVRPVLTPENGVRDLPRGITVHGRPGTLDLEQLAAARRADTERPVSAPTATAPSNTTQGPAPAQPPAATQPSGTQASNSAAPAGPGATPEAPRDPTAPRVFFISPKNGQEFLPYLIGTFERAIVFEFGIENFQIVGIPGRNRPARPDVGHYHFAMNTGCLAPGEPVPRRPPWVHLDDGETKTEMILRQPGKYTFTVQVGNDAHEAIAGLCSTIAITVIE